MSVPPEPISGAHRAEKVGGRYWRWLIVLAGIALGQVLLYGPSLAGVKILLPLDCLGQEHVYLPAAGLSEATPHDISRSDLVLQFEPIRRFVAQEYHAGRFPLWVPYEYGGSPLIWPRYSPFLFFSTLLASPCVLAWVQLAAALVAGFGMYAFCRRAIDVQFWPAVAAAWCYPLTGFFIFWQGFPTCGAIYWLPWLLFAVDRVLRRPGVGAVAGVAVTTGLTLVSGHLDVAGQALIIAALYAAAQWIAEFVRTRQLAGLRRAIAPLVLGWALGFAIALPQVWTVLDYIRTGDRFQHRAAGLEERQPAGWRTSLPEIVLPDVHGSSRVGSMRLAAGAQQESAAAGYGGAVMLLLLAPLAWFSRRHRSFTWCCLGLALFGLGWCLNLPGLVWLLRQPGLHILSHNRLVFVTAFATVALGAVGFDALLHGTVGWRSWCWTPFGLVLGIIGWCFYRAFALPEPIASQIGATIASGRSGGWLHTAADVARLQQSFRIAYIVPGLFLSLAAGVWIWSLRRPALRRLHVAVLAALAISDLLWFTHNRSAQCAPELYYPAVPVLQQIASAAPGRAVGYGCLLPTVLSMHGLSDVRGYDSVDPAALVSLLQSAADPQTPAPASYAATLWYIPRIVIAPGPESALRLPPVLNMLAVRYVIFAGRPPAGIVPQFSADGAWALVNRAALPRVFVPAAVRTMADPQERLRAIADEKFDPANVAYVEERLNLPPRVEGDGRILAETSDRVQIVATMKTAGLLVLGDAWNAGWRCRVNGSNARVLRVNHYLRGVELPSGVSRIEFYYRPASFAVGTLISLAVLLGMGGCLFWCSRRAATATADPLRAGRI